MEKENRQFKMMSLFDGSGGFPLAASLCGIKPVAASEIEPFPIKVTKARFPDMKHYWNISEINGADLEPVDIVTGGSPCQDMSVAGKREGMSKKCSKCSYTIVGNADAEICPECGSELEYTRSGLFMEQIRVIKEMREEDEARQLRMRGTVEHIRPRFMLWENVTGAFSSNKGEDFRAVLEETARICDKTAVIPGPPKGKWHNTGLIMGDGYSIAWRVFDAQFWGVPQRRRRIALVADFGGPCAGEILFKRDGLQRNFTESRNAWENLAGSVEKSIREAGECIPYDMTHANDVIREYKDGVCPTLQHRMGTGGNQVPLTMQAIGFDAYNQVVTGDKAKTLSTGQDIDHVPITMQVRCGDEKGGGKGALMQVDLSATLDTKNMQTLFQPIAYGISSYESNAMLSDNPNSGIYEADTSRTLDLNGGNPACNQGGIAICERKSDVICMATQQGNAEIMEDKCPTITASAGMSGNNQPVVCIEGNGSRPSHRGDGYKESDVMYTLNTTEQHAVAYEQPKDDVIILKDTDPACNVDENGISFSLTASDYKDPEKVCYQRQRAFEMKAFGNYSESEIASTMKSRDHKDATDLIVETEYIVRRLTPLECCRLQGFPDWWTDNISIPNPNGHDIAFWREVFETHRKLVSGAKKPKTDKQIIKWLQEPDIDGAKYKLWGNGIALPCFLYVMEGIKEVLDRTSNE